MRLLLVFLIGITGCNDNNTNMPKKDMGGGGLICPNHPENCQGTCCGQQCINTSIDRNNCGGCNAACTGGTVCMGGKCGCLPSGAPCGMGQTCCPNAGCANLMNDLRNCGTCGNACTNGETCASGACSCGGQTCGAGTSCCNGSCQATCNTPMPDMAMSSTGDGGLAAGLCDCRGLSDPLGSSNQCPISSTCVSNNCCAEDAAACAFGSCPPGTCVDMTPCTASMTPQ